MADLGIMPLLCSTPVAMTLVQLPSSSEKRMDAHGDPGPQSQASGQP